MLTDFQVGLLAAYAAFSTLALLCALVAAVWLWAKASTWRKFEAERLPGQGTFIHARLEDRTWTQDALPSSKPPEPS